MSSRQRRLVQSVCVVVLATVAIVTSPTRAVAAQVIWCYVCVNSCADVQTACATYCSGTIVTGESACWGSQSCTGLHGGSYTATGRCLMEQ